MLNDNYEFSQFKNKAIFECCKCKTRFNANPGPQKCIKCGHIWLTWLNYWELFK